jgi:hypothetical protein
VKQVSRVIFACLGLLPGPALAWDWSLNSTLSQTFELNNNQFMNTQPAGASLGSYSTITANAVALTPTSRLTVDSNVGYRKYWGPGTDGINQTESDNLGVNAHYEIWGKNHDDKDWFDGSFNRSSTLVAVLGDLGLLTNVHGDIDRMDTISFSATSTLTTYDPSSAGTQFTDSSAVATWSHRISPLTTVSATSQAEYLDFDTTPAANLTILRNTAGFETTLSPVLSYGGSAGVIYSDSVVGGSAISPIPGAPPSFTSGTTFGFIGDMHAIYRILKNTTLNLSAGQTVAPSIIGTLTKRSTLHAGVTQAINARSSISLATDLSQQTSSGSTNDFLSGSISYSYALAREWNASLTYRYLHRTTTTGGLLDPITGLPVSSLGPASSNSVMVVVSKTTTIIPMEN